MQRFKPGDRVRGAELLTPTVSVHGGRKYRAWVCRIHGEDLRIVKEQDLRKSKAPFRVTPKRAELNRIYASYRNRCIQRNIFFGLSIEEFEDISQRICIYCHKSPSNGGKHTRTNGIFTYNGIDRKDNKRGYTKDNSVPCCARCNGIKSNLLSFEEMKAAMGAILKLKKSGRKTGRSA